MMAASQSRIPNQLARTLACGALLIIGALFESSLSPSANGSAPLQVTSVDGVGLTVADMDRAVAFYTAVLPFEKVSDQEFSGRPYELLSGIFGARTRVVRLRLGLEQIELTEFVTPKGRPIPSDLRANDRLFQHIQKITRPDDVTHVPPPLKTKLVTAS